MPSRKPPPPPWHVRNRSHRLTLFCSYNNKDFLVLYAAGNSGGLSDSRTIGAPGTCKNCITVGATQLSDSLFRGMKPFVDQGLHCSLTTSGCCAATTDGTPRGLTCVQTSDTVSPCCSLVQNAKMSLACCPSQYTCSACSPPPSVESGNLRHAHNVATFSSRGTMFDDGRIKPDLVAPGEDILSAATPGVDGAGQLIPTDANFCGIPSATASRTATQSYNMALKLNSGTSMASPLAAGAIEKIRQYFVQGRYPSGVAASAASINPDSSLLRAVILASAKPLGGSGGVWTSKPYQAGFSRFPIPDNSKIPDLFGGFGLPILDNAVTMPGGAYRMLYTSGTAQATSTVASAFTITCTPSSSIPVTLVLAWTDPPGSTSSKKQLVNDLDLIVLSPSQLFGNMRKYADSNNVVERTICACPASGTITAIVTQGEKIKTPSQTWHLVANGAVNSIAQLSTVPAYNAGRVTNPVTTSTSCLTSSRTIHKLPFLSGQEWSGSSWDIALRVQEFTTALATFNRVDQQAIRVSVTSPADGTISLSLGCSAVLATPTTVAYVTAETLRSAISNNCLPANSPCTTDPILKAFDWNKIVDLGTSSDCGNGITCAPGHTCMSSSPGAGKKVTPTKARQLPLPFFSPFTCNPRAAQFACSPLRNAVRCSDARYSCPSASTCETGNVCLLNGVTTPATANVDPSAASVAGNICGAIINNFQIPNYCTCAVVAVTGEYLGGLLTCATGLPSTIRVSAKAVFVPCSKSRPPFFWFSASADGSDNV